MDIETMNVQRPIASSFGHSTTSHEVMRDVDLRDRVALVTGGHSGLGKETVERLLDAGASVIVLARRPDDARAALRDAQLDRVSFVAADLSDLDSVTAAAQEVHALTSRIDFVFAVAGVMASPLTRVAHGWEGQFAVNHLGHFALVGHLYERLTASGSARVVVYSSAGHHHSPIRWEDPHFEQRYDKWLAYGQAKTANALFAVHLDKIAQASGVRAFSLHPGAILTPLQRHLPKSEMVELGWIHEDGSVADATFKSVEQGAATGLWAATAKELDGIGGLYLEDCEVASIATSAWSPDEVGALGVMQYAVDPDEADRLWQLSTSLTGVNYGGA